MAKLLIGVCSWYEPKYQCVDALWRLQKPADMDKTDVFYSVSWQAAASRIQTVEKARKEGYEYILFVDADNVCHQKNTIIGLLDGLKQANSLIISGIYRCNLNHRCSNVTQDWRQPALLLEDVPYNIFQVDRIGFGIVLAKTELFDKIERPYFQWVEATETDTGLSEDYYFCDKIRAAGIPLYAHGAVRAGHLKQIMI